MKKRIALLLAAAMLLSMTACGGSAEPVETTVAEETVVETEPVKTIPSETTEETVPEIITPSLEESLLQDETATILETDNWDDYKAVLTEMGFVEPRIGSTVHESAIAPKRMIYNDTSFYMEFDAILHNAEITYESGWVLVGTKAEEESDIAAVNFADYSLESCETFRGQDAASERAQRVLGDKYPRITDYRYYRMIDPTLEVLDREVVAYATEYYPTTKNLYNYYCVKTIGLDEMGPWTNNISIMRSWEELVEQQWVAMYEAGQLRTFALGNLKYGYFFEPGMTFVDWASSPYNIDGWIFVDDHFGWLRHPETSEMVAIGYDKNGNRSLLEHKVGYQIMSVAEAKEWGYNP